MSFLTYQSRPGLGRLLVLAAHWCVDSSKLALVLGAVQPIPNRANILNNISHFSAHLACLLLVTERSFLLSFGIPVPHSINTAVKPPSICVLWQVSVALTFCNCSAIYLPSVFRIFPRFVSETVGKRSLKYNYFNVRKTPGAVGIVQRRQSKYHLKTNKKPHPNRGKTKKTARFGKVSAEASSYREKRLFLSFHIKNKAYVWAPEQLE